MWKVKFFLIILLCFVNCIRADDDGEICDHDQGFNCTDGSTIDCLDVCNGIKDCKDGSDEFLWNDITESPCRNQECPNDHVKCNYGACIPIEYHCDNYFNCADKSDEWKYYCNKHKENPEEFKSCESGDFIPKNEFCNGKIDCPRDGSDEWPNLCKLLPCPSNTHFRCKSGGCIPLTKKCNNIKDCHDNSDEKTCGNVIKNPVSTTPNQGCLVRRDRNYYIKNELENYNIIPGGRVPVNTRIIIKCSNNFFFPENNTEQRRICERNGRWDSPLPQCIKYCDARILNNSKSTTAQCSLRGSKVDCNKIVPRTVAKVSCADGYKMPEELGDSASYEMTCERDGKWSKRKDNCEPICGRYASDNASVAPWHVGVKTYLNQRCGGTIVSPSIVITALHCVQFEDDTALSVDKVVVIIDGNSVNVSDIFGGGDIDVALLKLSEILTLSKSIRPICITESVYIASSTKAFLHGWPKDTKKITEVFHKTELDVLPRRNCSAKLNGRYICVRPAYKLHRNETLCEGDSGSGITAESDGVNYIIGILSFKPARNDDCTNEPIVAVRFNQIPELQKTMISSDKEPLYEMENM
ncbi:PREDICTED: low-density lipoprotein receptor-related protein 8-like [Bactrocera latifrons]|uniref:Very low-density lipoprotein receptor n=1 Tax=Bactrocera latifrons TaxID=174628 RepID=A0A0K8W7J6_BACLA|nr:PREDICTED: low-density lipoprotein receptor-related protein 8-like [Bactrocera latifrons]